MKAIKLSDSGELHNVNGGIVFCPILSSMSDTGGVDYFACSDDCAWLTTKVVTDKGGIGFFCGDKFIGDLQPNPNKDKGVIV